MTPKNVYIAFTRQPGSFMSGIIRGVTSSNVSHALILYRSNEFQQFMTLESLASGFIGRSYAAMKREGAVINSLWCAPENDLWAGILKHKEKIGDDYDWFALPGELLELGWFALTKKKIKNVFQSDKKEFCSEIIARYILPESGIVLSRESPDGTVRPDELETMCARSPQFQQIPEPAKVLE